MVDVVKPLPPEAAVLPKTRQLWYLATLNRIRIGLFLLIVTGLWATFIDDGNVKAHRRIHLVEQLIMLVTGATGITAIAAGQFKSNEFHEQRLEAEVRETSGQYPVYQRRVSDKE